MSTIQYWIGTAVALFIFGGMVLIPLGAVVWWAVGAVKDCVRGYRQIQSQRRVADMNAYFNEAERLRQEIRDDYGF